MKLQKSLLGKLKTSFILKNIQLYKSNVEYCTMPDAFGNHPSYHFETLPI